MERFPLATDVIVVGGGLAGLAAACYLERAGTRVTLFEQSSGLGGRAATQVFEDFCFNRGAHALFTGGAASAVLAELGITYSHGSPSGTWLLHQNKLDPLPTSPWSLLTSPLLSLGDKMEFMSLFTALPRLNPASLASISVQEWLEKTIRRPLVRRIFEALARTTVFSAMLDVVSAEIFVSRIQLILESPIHYIDGGWQTIVQGLRECAERSGVRIETGAGVESIEYQDDGAQGVRLRDGRAVRAAAVVVATSPGAAGTLLGDRLDQSLRKTIDDFVPAQVACLDVALRRLPSTRHSVVQDLERPRFLTIQSLYARVAPEGAALLHAMKQLDSRHPGDTHADERDLEEFLDLTLPGWRDVVVRRVFLPRLTAVNALPTAARGGLAGRPGPRVAGVTNLYLAGDWVGPDGFLADASMASARQAARLVIETRARWGSVRTTVGSAR